MGVYSFQSKMPERVGICLLMARRSSVVLISLAVDAQSRRQVALGALRPERSVKESDFSMSPHDRNTGRVVAGVCGELCGEQWCTV